MRQNLSTQQVEELHEDIERYLGLEDAAVNLDFWTVCIRVIMEASL